MWSPENVMLQVEVPADDAEVAADRLFQAGAGAVEERPGPQGHVLLVAGFERADLTEPYTAVAGRWPVTVVAVGDDVAWRDAWRRHATAVRAGRRFVVQPTWVDPIGEPGDLVIEIDPGTVFGSGSHPSTGLALAVLEDHLQPGDRFLDIGCGSGVLAIGAVQLGADAAVAIDIDPEAVRVTEENAARNGVADRLTATTTPLAAVPGRFEVVACNVSETTHIELAHAIRAHVAPGGVLVLGGLLDGKYDGSLQQFPSYELIEVRTAGGWASPVLRAPS